jgi:hypothetical protein
VLLELGHDRQVRTGESVDALPVVPHCKEMAATLGEQTLQLG